MEQGLWAVILVGALALRLFPNSAYALSASEGSRALAGWQLLAGTPPQWWDAPALAAALGAVFLTLGDNDFVARIPSALGGMVACLLFAAGLFWPAAVASKTNGFQNAPTLNGERYLEASDAGEAAAIRWLRGQRQPRNAVVLEATGGQYSRFGRFSSGSGVPSVLGWAGHEVQWRGSDDVFRGRAQDIDAIYMAGDKREVMPIIRHYGITFIAVGALEQDKYPEGALTAFEEALPVAYRNDRVTIYRTNAGA